MEALSLLADLQRLRKAAIKLASLKDLSNEQIFGNAVKKCEQFVDLLNQKILTNFQNDEEISQLLVQLKSIMINLRTRNVETPGDIVETELQHCQTVFHD